MDALQARVESFQGSKRLKHPGKPSTTTSARWPHPRSFIATPDTLAEAGFFFAPAWHDRDNVVCFACGKEISDWEEGDDPFEIHWAKCRSCPWAIVRCSIQEDLQPDGSYAFASEDRLPTSDALRKARLETFLLNDHWPHDTTRGHGASSKRMATGGFVYSPQVSADDTATCLYCGLALSGWDAADNPIEEHRKRASRSGTPCAFFFPTLLTATGSSHQALAPKSTTSKPSSSNTKPSSRTASRKTTTHTSEAVLAESGSDDELAASITPDNLLPTKKGRAGSKTPGLRSTDTAMSALTSLPSTTNTRTGTTRSKGGTSARSKSKAVVTDDDAAEAEDANDGENVIEPGRHVSKSTKGASSKRTTTAATKKSKATTSKKSKGDEYMDVEEPVRDPEDDAGSGPTGSGGGRGRKKGRTTTRSRSVSRARSKSRAPSPTPEPEPVVEDEDMATENEVLQDNEEDEDDKGSKNGKGRGKAKGKAKPVPAKVPAKTPAKRSQSAAAVASSGTGGSRRGKKAVVPDGDGDSQVTSDTDGRSRVQTPASAMEVDDADFGVASIKPSSKSRSGSKPASKSRPTTTPATTATSTRSRKTVTPVTKDSEDEGAEDDEAVPKSKSKSKSKKPPSKSSAAIAPAPKAKGKTKGKASKSPAILADDSSGREERFEDAVEEREDTEPKSDVAPVTATKPVSKSRSKTPVSAGSAKGIGVPVKEAKKRTPKEKAQSPPPSPPRRQPEPEPESVVLRTSDTEVPRTTSPSQSATQIGTATSTRSPSPGASGALEEAYLPPPSGPPSDSEADGPPGNEPATPRVGHSDDSDDDAQFVERSLDIEVPIKEGRRVPRRSTPLPSPTQLRREMDGMDAEMPMDVDMERAPSPTDGVRRNIQLRMEKDRITPSSSAMSVDVDVVATPKPGPLTHPDTTSANTAINAASTRTSRPAPQTPVAPAPAPFSLSLAPPFTPAPFLAPLSLAPLAHTTQLTDAERAMTVEEWIRHEMEVQYAQLKLDGEVRIQQFRERAAEVRKRIDAL